MSAYPRASSPSTLEIPCLEGTRTSLAVFDIKCSMSAYQMSFKQPLNRSEPPQGCGRISQLLAGAFAEVGAAIPKAFNNKNNKGGANLR